MAGKLARVALVIAAIGLPLQMAPAAHAEVTIDTKPVIPSANGLVCTVVNVSQKPMGITAQIIDGSTNAQSITSEASEPLVRSRGSDVGREWLQCVPALDRRRRRGQVPEPRSQGDRPVTRA